MTTVKQMANRWRSFNEIEAAGESMLENKEEIIGLNQYQLYEQGIGNDGKPLPPYTDGYYARQKQAQRGKTIVDLWRTGRMQTEMNLSVNGNEYTIFSSAPYTHYVVNPASSSNARPTAFGLTEESKKNAWFIIHDSFVSRLKEHTGTA